MGAVFALGEDTDKDIVTESAAQKVTVRITCSHNGTSVDVSHHKGNAVTVDWTTDQLQQPIQGATGVHQACQRLMFAGKKMGPDDTILSIAGPNPEEIPERINVYLMVDQERFPQKLGPFSITRVPFNIGDFEMPKLTEVFTQTGFYWDMKIDLLKSYGLRAQDGGITGQVSPVAPITLGDIQRATLMIPKDATQFVWSYPLCDWQCVESDAYAMGSWDVGATQVEGSSAMQNFLSVGGFIYFNRDGQMSGVTTVGKADSVAGSMNFAERRKWERDWTSSLVASGRFQKVTIKEVAGAQYFCWLKPSEIITGDDGTPLATQPEVPHGGFVYLFHESLLSKDSDDLALDCYFPVEAAVLISPSDGPYRGHVDTSSVAAFSMSSFQPHSLNDQPDVLMTDGSVSNGYQQSRDVPPTVEAANFSLDGSTMFMDMGKPGPCPAPAAGSAAAAALAVPSKGQKEEAQLKLPIQKPTSDTKRRSEKTVYG